MIESIFLSFIVKQNCCWKIVVRRMQGVHSIASTNLYAEDKERFLFAYDAPMTFQIHFCLTINRNKPLCEKPLFYLIR